MGLKSAIVTCIAWALPFAAFPQTLRQREIPQTRAEMHQRVLAIYDFHPSQVSDAERKAKSAEMDIFWNELKAMPDLTLPLVRAELRDPSTPNFFLTDGTQLLLSLSKAKPDEELTASVLPRVDLADTQSGAYFFEVHGLACEGIDVTEAALHILDDPKFKVPLPQHAMVLDQRMALMYVLLSMKEDIWVSRAEARFSVEKDVSVKLALLFALFYAQTDEADKFLTSISIDSSQPESIQKQAKEFLSDAQKTGKSLLPVRGTVAEIREKRRLRLRAVSDEAMDDVQWMTRKIVQLRAKGKS